MLSFEWQVAHRLEGRNLKFIYLACSGATILNGLIGPYAGIAPPPFHYRDLPAQVDEAKRLAGKETPDAVMISIGANDMHFGNVAEFCVFSELPFRKHYCPGEIYQDGLTLEKWVPLHLKHRLPKLYDDLAVALERWGVPARRVFIAGYPDLISETPTKRCKSIFFRPGYTGKLGDYEVNEREVEWLYKNFYLPLNEQIQKAALQHGWKFVAPPPEFNEHGYCTKETWIVTYKQSQERQGNTNGTLHPNEKGQTAMANAFDLLVSSALSLATRPVLSAPPPPVSAPPPAPPRVTG
jgi:lysophospholipase L1-like esterase